ncbi:hypothetical protein IRJ41_003196 [Triplophysa rosa]|uniref:Uncharacterized protein n=1 Tax=Triplophysa rosa TaxID=992332 RepID=A0A9W8C2G0_TRIRA|nr:hypothetical protein IRJ41_003196 [Triplophysa rosa]
METQTEESYSEANHPRPLEVGQALPGCGFKEERQEFVRSGSEPAQERIEPLTAHTDTGRRSGATGDQTAEPEVEEEPAVRWDTTRRGNSGDTGSGLTERHRREKWPTVCLWTGVHRCNHMRVICVRVLDSFDFVEHMQTASVRVPTEFKSQRPESDERRFFLFAAAVDPNAGRGILFFGNLRPFRNEMMMVMRWERGACGRRGEGC